MINLWDPTHVSLGIDLVTAFLLGIVHGATPDEHTWPITFSYAIGSYSTWRGVRAGLVFSLAFTIQRAMASELAYLGLAQVFVVPWLNGAIYVVVGLVMAWTGSIISSTGRLPHFHIRRARQHEGPQDAAFAHALLTDPRPWMPALHGFIAGWGFGAFATIIYTVLAPAMPSAALGWTPGALFGLGTATMQVIAGAGFGYWAARTGLDAASIRHVGLVTAARTLFWGGVMFTVAGVFVLAFPSLADAGFSTGLKVHNLHTIGLPLLLVIVVVAGVGITTLVREMRRVNRTSFPGGGLA